MNIIKYIKQISDILEWSFLSSNFLEIEALFPFKGPYYWDTNDLRLAIRI